MRKVLKWLFIFLLIFVVVIITGVFLFKDYNFMNSPSSSPKIRVLIIDENRTVDMSLESYLVGVVAGEMPARFEKEALKAQAIAARTYTLRKLKYYHKQVNKDHPQAHLCTRPEHCQAWLSEKEMKAKWGLTGYWNYGRKIYSAVQETAGIVLTYNNELIEPVYHSTSGDKTENAEEVWKYAIPYLKSVHSKWDRESPKYQAKTIISFSQIDARLGTNLQVIPAAKINGTSVIKVLKKTSTGRIKEIRIGNKTLMATEFRRILGLNSTNFTWKINGDKIEFTTIGYGHGVGMSQYGANGMAKEGKKAGEILKHYYTGVNLKKYY